MSSNNSTSEQESEQMMREIKMSKNKAVVQFGASGRILRRRLDLQFHFCFAFLVMKFVGPLSLSLFESVHSLSYLNIENTCSPELFMWTLLSDKQVDGIALTHYFQFWLVITHTEYYVCDNNQTNNCTLI
eukprot:c23101_g1_i2 orf=357-746(+)